MSGKLEERLKKKVVILDGATGTMLQQRGMPGGVCPEQFCLDNPELILQLQAEYLEAGADMVMSPTFGANRIKLKNYGLDARTAEINQRLAEQSLHVARSRNGLVAGEVGPTGLFFEPFGETAFDLGLEIYQEQIRVLAQAGVDCILLATHLDIQEARIALLAAKEATSLPVLVSMTFDEQGRTLTGSDALCCLNILQSLGAAGFGINCSTGPEAMLQLIRSIAAYARIPLLVKPNAGLPLVEQGRTVFPMGAEAFNAFTEKFWEAGVRLMGGCCGTTPEHIRRVSASLQNRRPKIVPGREHALLLSSPQATVVVEPGVPLRLVGERINPTGKPKLQAELKAGRLDLVKAYAQQQRAQGADILDVNVSVPGVEEKGLMLRVVAELSRLSENPPPLCIDSSSPDVIEAAVRFYPGRALLNSISGERAKLEKILPVIRKYGPAFIVLPLDDKGIPETLDERKAILKGILKQCTDLGIPADQAVVDGLALTVSANPAHVTLALQMIAYASQELGLSTVLGLSNISFGMPHRPVLNSTFLAMAMARGLSLVIANPGEESLPLVKAAADVLIGRDPGGRRFLNLAAPAAAEKRTAPAGAEDPVTDVIIQGEKEKIEEAIKKELDQGADPMRLLEKKMFPAIQEVGKRYQDRRYFLPQLLASAETMERGVHYLAPLMKHEGQAKKATVILATVKGDVHDIGKKIVGLLLRNNGYEVIDLGKSVDEREILSQAVKHKARIIALSALMTTTMTEMPKVISLARKEMPGVKVIIGGAVVTPKYAEEIGADGYAADSVQAVALADQLIGTI